MNILFTSLALGSLYCLIAICFVFYFAYAKFLNVAILAYIALAAHIAGEIVGQDPGYLNLIFGVLIACIVIITLSFAVDNLIFHQLSNMNSVTKVIASISVLLIILTMNAIIWPESAILDTPFGIKSIQIFSSSVLIIDIVSILVSVLVLVIVWLFVNRTDLGRRIRALSSDAEVANAYGISRRSVSIAVSVVTGIICTITGVALASPGSPRAGVIGVIFFSLIAMAAVIIARHEDVKIAVFASFVVAFAQTVAAANTVYINDFLNSTFARMNIETNISLGPTFADRFVPFFVAIIALIIIPKRFIKAAQ